MGFDIMKELEMISVEFECGGWVANDGVLCFYKQVDEQEYKVKLKTNANIDLIWIIIL